ncbi:E3 ubiquitin ligase BIG BROTHER-related isoform X4 [Coffea arabica]|uniref:E3 ubiquitin ligase BIG BROTHER-related isoform X4 n=1 Tax=Coffea arabica TaxID=13443 RepID=A0ABM4WCM4_COFAR
MMSETFVIDNNEVSVHLNDRIPAEIAENFKEFFPEDGDLSLEEVLLQQESAFQYIQANGKNKDKTSNNGQTSNRSQPIVQEGECSSGATDQLQSATDEALARALQEYFYIYERSGTVAGEAVGHESKGLSEVLIARLPTFKYKTGLFSKKRKKECVICCSEYKSGARLTTLPCAHQYHSECITRWLKLNKNCPVCQEEVRED